MNESEISDDEWECSDEEKTGWECDPSEDRL